MITNSYSSKSKRIFLSRDIIIEDDINPNFHSSSNASDLNVEQYFKELDLKYRKSDGQSIVLTDLNVSNVKRTNVLYVKVYFSSIFKNAHKYIDTAYIQNNRVAEINIQKENNGWAAYISRISFYKPSDTVNDNSTDIQLIREKGAVGSSEAMDSAALASRQKSFDERLKMQKEKELIETDRRETQLFKDFMNQGDKALDENDFTGALSAYKKAGDLKAL